MSCTLFVSKIGQFIKMALKKNDRLIQLHAVLPWNPPFPGTIYAAKVIDIDEGLNAAFLDLGEGREGFLRLNKGRSNIAAKQSPGTLRRGQSLVVQVQKTPAPGKRLPCSLHPSLAGFHLIYEPSGQRTRFSRRFSGEKKDKIQLIKEQKTEGGWLFRSSSVLVSSSALEREINYLGERWQRIQQAFLLTAKPRILDDEDADPLGRVLSDSLSAGLNNVYVDHEETYRNLMLRARERIPFLCDKIVLHSGSCSLFATYGMDSGFTELTRSKIWLKSGGYLLFNQTEALTVIDVNSGKAKLGEGQKLKVNLQAAADIARHIMLREIGGMIVIDFVNLSRHEAMKQVEDCFRRELGSEQVHCRIEPINSLGLLCMSRRRLNRGLWEQMNEHCSLCHGTGYTKNLDAVLFELLSALREEFELEPGNPCSLRLGTELFRYTRNVHFPDFLPQEWNVTIEKTKEIASRSYQLIPGS